MQEYSVFARYIRNIVLISVKSIQIGVAGDISKSICEHFIGKGIVDRILLHRSCLDSDRKGLRIIFILQDHYRLKLLFGFSTAKSIIFDSET